LILFLWVLYPSITKFVKKKKKERKLDTENPSARERGREREFCVFGSLLVLVGSLSLGVFLFITSGS
jgi:hypothetical protein